MTSLQSTLGDEAGIAEELAESQQSISIAEFFEKNKHMLGFDSGARGLVTAVKEAVDNALDAAEESGILPDIYVEIQEAGDYYRLIVGDNGPGLTKETLPKVFGKLLYGSLSCMRTDPRSAGDRNLCRRSLRPADRREAREDTSRTQGSSEAEYFELIIDTDENEARNQRRGRPPGIGPTERASNSRWRPTCAPASSSTTTSSTRRSSIPTPASSCANHRNTSSSSGRPTSFPRRPKRSARTPRG